MKSIYLRRVLGLLCISVLGLASCDETTTSTAAILCTPAISAILPPDGTLSTAGGEIQLTGRNFWQNFSSTSFDTTTPAADATPADSPTPVPFTSRYDIVVLIGEQAVPVTEAYEQTIELDPSVAPRDLEGNLVPSNCETCTACITANVENSTGCGGCDAQCMGCQQVISAQMPPVSLSDGELSASGSIVQVPITVISGINYSATVYYDLTNVCGDGLDNDSDGQFDSDDPGCAASGGTSE